MNNGYFVKEGPYLAHHGVLGMKWGVRRYQNYDGSYKNKSARDRHAAAARGYSSAVNTKKVASASDIAKKKSRRKKVIIATAAVATAFVGAYAAKKYMGSLSSRNIHRGSNWLSGSSYKQIGVNKDYSDVESLIQKFSEKNGKVI